MAAGLLPVLSILGVISIPVAEWLSSVAIVFSFVVAFAGLMLIVDSFHEIGSLTPLLGWVTLIVGFVVVAFGVIQSLVTIGVLAWGWWPSIPDVFFYALFMLEGILLFIAGFLD